MALIDNLVTYYKLDEAAGAVLDSHGTNDGTNYGATPNVAGKINTCYDFDGYNDYIDTEFIPTTNSPMTWAFWINPGTMTTTKRIMSSTTGGNEVGGLQFQFDATNKIRVVSGDGTGASIFGVSTTTITTGNWFFVVFTFDGSTSKLYVNDGAAELSDTWTPQASATELDFGRRAGGSVLTTHYYDGKIDEVGIWSRAITDAEVLELYNSGSGLAYPFAVVGTNIQINIGDVFKDVDAMKVNIGDAWKDVAAIKQNIGDVWKDVF